MKTIKKIGLVSAVAFAMLALSACDDSSSAGGDEQVSEESSSSSYNSICDGCDNKNKTSSDSGSGNEPNSSGSIQASGSSGSTGSVKSCKTENDDRCEYKLLTDARDGKEYRIVKIGNQWWMAENLDYRTEHSLCYDGQKTYCVDYGSLYKKEDALVVCPTGWHLPSSNEWRELFAAVGGEKNAGLRLKSIDGWRAGSGIDAYGFSALPGGINHGYLGITKGYVYLLQGTFFWTSSENSIEYISVGASDQISIGSDYTWVDAAFSVRCVKDTDSDFSAISEYSSSSLNLDSEAKVMPSGTYDCKKYHCCATEGLNETFVKQGYYGEVLDERTKKVYPTLQVGYQTWMAVNIDKTKDSCYLSGGFYTSSEINEGDVCPTGWHVASENDWRTLNLLYSGVYGQNEWYRLSQAGRENLGLSFVEDMAWFDYSFGNRGYTYWAGYQGCVGLTSSFRIYDKCYSMHARCVKDIPQMSFCRGEGFDNCAYGEMLDSRDGKKYQTIEVGGQTWMNESLRYDDSIAMPSLLGNIYHLEKDTLISLGKSFVDNSVAYRFAGLMDSLNSGCGYKTTCDEKRGVCPIGWHIITLSEIYEMRYFLGVFYEHDQYDRTVARGFGINRDVYHETMADSLRIAHGFELWTSSSYNEELAHYYYEVDGLLMCADCYMDKGKTLMPVRCAKDRQSIFPEDTFGAMPPK